MRGGALPPALLCAALAFALAFVPRQVILPALLALCAVAILVVLLPLKTISPELIFAGCWLSIVATAATVHIRWHFGMPVALLLGANAGLWAGAVVAISGIPTDLARALPVALLAFPAGWLVVNRGAIAVKVVASWLVAVAILAGTLPIVPTPGYVQDHME